MKKLLLSLLLIVALLIGATACSFSDPYADGIPVYDPTTGEETQPPQQPSNPADLIGTWHFSQKATVYCFYADGTMQVYYLTPGYYEYDEIVNGTYTYDGITLSYTLEDTTSFSGACSVSNSELSISYSSQTWKCTPVEALPTLHPVYSFPDYKALAATLTLPNGIFTGNTIEAKEQHLSAISNVLYMMSYNEITPTLQTEGIAQEGDIVNIDYEGKLDGVAFSGGTKTNQTVAAIDGTGMIDGFGAQIVGHTVGEKFDINVTFPEDYQATDLAGKAVVFTMKLNGIYDVANDVNAEYKEFLKAEVFTLIPGLSEMEVPAESYQCILQYALDYYHYYAFYYGYDYNTFISLYGISEEELIKNSQTDARIYLQAFMLAKEYGVTPDEAYTNDFKETYMKDLTESGYSEEEATEYLNGEGKNIFETELMLAFISDYLVENNTFVPAC